MENQEKNDLRYTVYKHTTPGGKVYVGLTQQDPEQRWRHGKGYKANTGRFRSDQVRENMSKAQIKTKKPVRCIDLDMVFESETAAMKYFGIDKTLIGRNCKGKQKTAKGLRFEYV